MAGQVSKAEYETLAAFRYALRQFLHFSEVAAAEVGLTPQQYQALIAIKGSPGREQLTIGDLAAQLLIRHHSAVGLVDRLVLQELVKREQAADDRRQVCISLTDKGNTLLDELASIHREELRRIGPELTALLGQISSSSDRT